jgi:hypothetical protein
MGGWESWFGCVGRRTQILLICVVPGLRGCTDRRYYVHAVTVG